MTPYFCLRALFPRTEAQEETFIVLWDFLMVLIRSLLNNLGSPLNLIHHFICWCKRYLTYRRHESLFKPSPVLNTYKKKLRLRKLLDFKSILKMKLAAGLAQAAMAKFMDDSGILMLFWFTKTLNLSTQNITIIRRHRVFLSITD